MTPTDSHAESRRIIARLFLGLSVLAAAIGAGTLLSGGDVLPGIGMLIASAGLVVGALPVLRAQKTADARLAVLDRTFE